MEGTRGIAVLWKLHTYEGQQRSVEGMTAFVSIQGGLCGASLFHLICEY